MSSVIRFPARPVLLGVLTAWLVALSTDESRAQEVADTLVLKVAKAYTGAGPAIKPAIVVISKGKIVAIGSSVNIPAGATVKEYESATITAGLIDADCSVDVVDLMLTPSAPGVGAAGSGGPPAASWENRTPAQMGSRQRDAAFTPSRLGQPGFPNGGDRSHAAPSALKGLSPEAAQFWQGVLPDAVRGTTPSGEMGVIGDFTAQGSSAVQDARRTDEFADPLGRSRIPALPGQFHVVEEGQEDIENIEEIHEEGPSEGESAPLAAGTRPGVSFVESGSEVTPHLRAREGLSVSAVDLGRLAREGVTTIFVSNCAGAVIGPRGAIVRTAGPEAERILRLEADVTVTLGAESYRLGARNRTPFLKNVDLYVRRPTTRMGVTWVLRKAFYDAMRFEKGLPLSGADAPEPEACPALLKILKGEIPVRVSARTQHDIFSAFRLLGEFGVHFTLVEATDAYRALDELAAAGTPVIFGPIYQEPSGPRAWLGETQNNRLFTLRALLDKGLSVALTAQDLRDEEGLARQAMYAMKTGLSREEALAAVTTTPAKLMGIDKEAGTIGVNRRADLVVWSGEPFEALSKPLLVLSGGKPVDD